ncbi:MAG: hypothetical protein E7519_15955 [Ruminococcaceae bacterium]|nr:hypothetical protein [Oscillospiraceae bacterium]
MSGFQRRDLLTLPVQRCTLLKIENLPFSDKERTQYIITAERYRLKDREILKATLFNAIDRAPEYLIFCDSGNNEFWTYDVTSCKWRETMIQNIPDDQKTPMLAIANDGSTAAAEYFGQPNRLTSYCILDFELDVRDTHGHNIPSGAKSRYYESRIFIDTVMEQAGPLPRDIDHFIDNRVLPHSRYLYYRRRGKMLDGYCSHCRTEVTLHIPKGAKKGQLNEVIAFCPHCHSKVRLKMAGRACNMKDGERMEYIQRVADGFLVRSMVAYRFHDSDYLCNPPEGWTSEDFRTYFSFNGRIRMFEYYHHHITGEDEWVFQRYAEPYGGGVYSGNLRKIFNGTKFQHSGLSEFIKHDSAPIRSDRYLEKYLSAPAIELLSKIGMTRLVRGVIGDRYSSGVYLKDPGASNPAEALGVTRQELKEMRALNISGEGFSLWKKMKKAGYAVNTAMMKKLWDYGISEFWSVEQIAKHGDILKTVEYMRVQGEKKRNLSDWADYISNCKKLGYDITDKHVKYPHEFRKMHDRVADEVVGRENKIRCKAFESLYRKYSKIYGYADRNFMVVIPKSPNDLIREGREMHHCVGTYIDRYAGEESIILFIRRKEAPDVPFITAEIGPDNRPVQIQDKRDKQPPEEVMRFWEKYQKVVLTAAADKAVKNRKAG